MGKILYLSLRFLICQVEMILITMKMTTIQQSPLFVVSLSVDSVTHCQSWPENIEGKIPDIMYVSICALF